MISEQIKEAKEANDVEELQTLRDIRHGLVKHMAGIRDRKRLYEVELVDHNVKKPRQVEALYEQVGNFDDATTTTGTTGTTRSGTTVNLLQVHRERRS